MIKQYSKGKKYKFECDGIKASYLNARAGTVFVIGITAMQCSNIVLKLLPLDA